MKFPDILRRLTGISTPIFGVSWTPAEAEINVAKRLVSNLEDRRVLYNPNELELPPHCVHSVVEIRHLLSAELANLSDDSKLGSSIRAMRAACRKFLDDVQVDERIVSYGAHPNHYASWHFNSALGELRGVFGIHLAMIAAMYGLNIEDDLAKILPIESDGENHTR